MWIAGATCVPITLKEKIKIKYYNTYKHSNISKDIHKRF